MRTATEAGNAAHLTQFHEAFFDDAAEHLAQMEALLLDIDVAAPEGETLNAIFRAVHSIKGGAATFGFQDITDLTHAMEAVFDRVRKSEMALDASIVDACLASGDLLKELLARCRAGGADASRDEVNEQCERLHALLQSAPAQPAKDKHVLEIEFGPFDQSVTASQIEGVLTDLAGFGEIAEAPRAGKETGTSARTRRVRLTTDVAMAVMEETLRFMVSDDHVKVKMIETISAGAAPSGGSAPDPVLVARAETDGNVVMLKEPTQSPAGNGEGASIRVNVQKVDSLINLVGELVITQAMLAQTAAHAGPTIIESLRNGLSLLERNTRDLQDAAMSIRMMPISFVFSRFPRLVRDLAAKLGKEVELRTVGDDAELDKGLTERIIDPLTHLVRNSLDHGIELPEERAAKGKPRRGTITLRAYQRGGSITIEVADDGAGLDRARILAKARERGMALEPEMSDRDVWQLIFEPGLTTTANVTDVSGRGVGMDVVRRNVAALGGRIEIDSVPGRGTQMSIRLPLTLAILDGMSVRVGSETYILPLGAVFESLQPASGTIRTIPGTGEVIDVRGEYLPVVALHKVFGLRSDAQSWDKGIMVIVEAESGKTALFVDELVGQHQVVIKSIETNYRKVPGVSGATIMGDGRVALILDVAYLATRSVGRRVKVA